MTDKRWTDVGTIAYLALKAGQLKYQTEYRDILKYRIPNRLEKNTDKKIQIPIPTLNTDTDP